VGVYTPPGWGTWRKAHKEPDEAQLAGMCAALRVVWIRGGSPEVLLLKTGNGLCLRRTVNISWHHMLKLFLFCQSNIAISIGNKF
jgi:hypothetical protein